ncbi:MAG: NAD-glutamate dehydrogenase domain-containing protein, partial [Pseudomonadota bacterium]
RFGAVARGGLRWSDRPQDFRTEVLGLVKAQQVKNAVIVPVGAKGGFVPKQLPTGDDRNAWFEEGRESYKVFINSLLDVTDNLDGADLIAPENVVRLDGDDPYLVVAADKGTATFSDTANAISQSRDFWLDDAFASGGSAGYDHKKMGITARGGWEAVKRHFREMDWDIQTQPFTVVGCGDMSGDVFGNGMLLSEQIKLVAAFDHRDIFIDPDPDPATSFAERKRLFEMGRSSWKDYDEALISKGGGVFSRSQKALQISQEIRDVLDIAKSRVSPFELITAILKADADLLWFGGIGTYVRAPQESDADVGDRANDAVRITTDDLRVKVIGEGANLGVTQKARIAFGLGGGRVNSDAIDNSAGVNSSDVEVNIKIALGAAVRAGKLKIKARNTLLASMTDEVTDLVLRNNYQQTLALSIAERRGLAETEFQARFMADLEGRGLLDRAVEDLPDPIALSDRIADGKPLTRPELAVLLAYAKITLFDDLLATDVPDDPYFERDLIGYFPSKMQKKYASEIGDHRLRREIVATFLANSMINRGGPVFVNRLVDQTGASLADIARAYAATRAAFDMPSINAAIDALDTKIGGLTQVDLYKRVQDLLWRQTPWFLRYADFSEGIGAVAETYRKGIATLAKSLDTYLEPQAVARRDAAKTGLADVGVPDALAKQLADMEMLEAATDVIRIAENTASKLSVAAKIYFGIGSTFGTDTLMAAMSDHAADDYFDRVALNQAMVAVATAQRRIAETVIADHGTGAKAIDAWQDSIGVRGARTREMVSGLSTDANLSVSKFSVAAAMLGDLAPA